MELILYNSSSGLQEAEYVKVKYKLLPQEECHIGREYSYLKFLRLINGKIIPIEQSFPLQSGLPQEAWWPLGFSYVSAHDFLVYPNENIFLEEKYFEIESNRYCMVYHLKAPLIGKVKYCSDSKNVLGLNTVNYALGTTTITEAKNNICEKVANELGLKCKNNQVELMGYFAHRDPDDSLYYLIITRSTIRHHPLLKRTEKPWASCLPHPSVPTEFDVRTYRVNAKDGQITLIEHTPSTFSGSHSYRDGGDNAWIGIMSEPFPKKHLSELDKSMIKKFWHLLKYNCQNFMKDNEILDGLNVCSFMLGQLDQNYLPYLSKIDMDGDGKLDIRFIYGGRYGIAFLDTNNPFLMAWPKHCSSDRLHPLSISKEEIMAKEQQCIAEEKAKIVSRK